MYKMISQYSFYTILACALLSVESFAQDTTITIPKKDYEEVLKYYFPSKEKTNNIDIFTDRPHQTETAEMVPYKHFQIESGISMEIDHDGDTRNENIYYNSLLMKYGIGSGMDLRVGIDYLNNSAFQSDSLLSKTKGLSGLSFGGKKFLYRGTKYLPKVSLMAEMYLPYFGKKEFRPNFTGGTLRLLCEHEIGENTELEYNFGPDWGGIIPNISYFYAVSLTQKVAGPLSIYGEIYGFFNENKDLSYINDFRCDAGFVYLLKKNLQLDLEGGIAFTSPQLGYFAACGISWRVPN